MKELIGPTEYSPLDGRINSLVVATFQKHKVNVVGKPLGSDLERLPSNLFQPSTFNVHNSHENMNKSSDIIQ